MYTYLSSFYLSIYLSIYRSDTGFSLASGGRQRRSTSSRFFSRAPLFLRSHPYLVPDLNLRPLSKPWSLVVTLHPNLNPEP